MSEQPVSEHPATRFLLPAFLLLALLAFVPSPAHAEDPAPEDTAAARLFREAWWLETGAGALEQAKAKYEAALAAQGSAKVRARALYRLGIVLHRMGKREEGVRTLERLVTEFAGETETLAKAKGRLEEWVGQDLRGAFGDWYRRYQFSPVFQAKVADLVLKLGARDYKLINTATEELRAIGEAAIPALRAHASRNGQIGQRSVNLLWELGTVPPLDGLLTNTGWARSHKKRGAIKADAALLADLRKALQERGHDFDAWYLAALDGQEAVLDHFLSLPKDTKHADPHLVHWATDREVPQSKIAALRAMAVDPEASSSMRGAASGALHVERGHVDVATVYAWVGAQSSSLRTTARNLLYGRKLEAPDAWRPIAQRMLAIGIYDSEARSLTNTLIQVLRDVDAGAPIEEADRVFMQLGSNQQFWRDLQGHGSKNTGNEAAKALMERWLNKQTGPRRGNSGSAYSTWRKFRGQTELARDCLRLAAHTRDLGIVNGALYDAGQNLTDGLPAFMALVKDKFAKDPVAEAAFNGLRRNPRLPQLGWTPALLKDFFEISADPAHSKSRAGMNYLTTQLMETQQLRTQILDLANEDPTLLPRDFWSTIRQADYRDAEGKPLPAAALVRGWQDWSDEQRRYAVNLHLAGLRYAPHERIQSRTARSLLREHGMSVSFPVRRALYDHIRTSRPAEDTPGRGLEDLLLTFDLSDRGQFSSALREISTLRNGRMPVGHGVEPEAIYDAFQIVFDPKIAGHAFRTFATQMFSHMAEGGALAHRELEFMRSCLRRGDAVAIGFAIKVLRRRNSTDDLSTWHRLLKHESADIRAKVATTLGALYSTETIRHLAALVDDKNPAVRDAALTSLEKIKKTEEQKDYWRKFAEEKAGKDK